MKINLLGKKKLIWLGCFLYTTNFYASSDSSSRANSIAQIQTDITALIQEASANSFGITDKLSRLYNASGNSGIFANISDLPTNKIKAILDILGCDPTQSDPNSVSSLLKIQPITPQIAGFNGDFPGEIGSIHSRLNEILNIIARHNILDPIGYTSDTALENGRTIWARIKYLYNDLTDNKEEKIKTNINSVYSTTQKIMSDHLQKSQTSLGNLITSAGEPEEINSEDIESYQFSYAKQQINAITTTLNELGDTYESAEESGLNDKLASLDNNIQTLKQILNSIENPDVIQKFTRAQEALNQIAIDLSTAPKTFLEICDDLKTTVTSVATVDTDASSSQKKLEQASLPDMPIHMFKSHIDTIKAQITDDSVLDAMKTNYNILDNFQAMDPIKQIKNNSNCLAIFTQDCQAEILKLSDAYAPIFPDNTISTVSETLKDVTALQNQIETDKLKENTTQLIEESQKDLDQCKDSATQIDHSKNIIENLSKASEHSETFSNDIRNDCDTINNFNLTNQVTTLQKSIDHLIHNPQALAVLGSLDNAILYKPYKIIPLLHLVQNSLTSLVYSFTDSLFSNYTQSVKNLLNNLQTVIQANNRDAEIPNLENTLVRFYTHIASNLSKELTLSSNNFQEYTETLKELNEFISKNSSVNDYVLSNVMVADISNIARIQSYTWPKLTSEATINIGNFIQPGLTLMNCTHKIRQALSVYPLFLQIGYASDTKDSLSLIGKIKSINTQIEAKANASSSYINYNPLILLRDLIEMYPAVSFVNQNDENQTFIQWLTSVIGSGEDVFTNDSIANLADESANPSDPVENPPAPDEGSSDPVDPSQPSENPSDSVEKPSQNPSNSLFAEINKLQNDLNDISPEELSKNIDNINHNLQMIAATLNAIINAKITSLDLVPIQENWYDYGELFKLILNNNDIAQLNLNDQKKLQQELYARPLLFQINGIPNIEEDTLLSKIQQNSGNNKIAQSWIHFQQSKTSNLSLLNFVSRTILENASYLNTAIFSSVSDESANTGSDPVDENNTSTVNNAVETTISQLVKDKIVNTEPDKASIYQITDGFYKFIATFFQKTESPDEGTTTYALASSDRSITTESTDQNITKALQTLDIPHEAFLERLTTVYNSIMNAQTAWFPIRLEKIIEKLYKIQNNLAELYTKINDVTEETLDFEKTMYVKTILGTSLEDHRASSSIFGCLNNIITECGAQLLVNMIGTPTDYQDESLFALLYQREMESTEQNISSSIQSAMSACNELANRILTKAIDFVQDTSTSGLLSTTATAIYTLADKITEGEALDSIILQINSIYNS